MAGVSPRGAHDGVSRTGRLGSRCARGGPRARTAMVTAHFGSTMRLGGSCGFEQQELPAGGGGRVGNATVRLE